MSEEYVFEAGGWAQAELAAALFAVDPIGTGGIALRSLPGPVRDRWLVLVRELLPVNIAWRRIPLHVNDSRLLGGLDLAATLERGHPIAQRGILAEADGGVLLLAMAERLSAATAARIGAVLDTQQVHMQRDGVSLSDSARLGVIALDEGIADEERPPSGLLDRLAFHLNLSTIAIHEADELSFSIEEIVAARACLSTVQVSEADIEALCATAAALGIASARAPLLALRAARAAAALAGRSVVSQDDVKLAGRLVLGSRATVLPAPPDEQETADESNTQPDNEPSDAADDNEQDDSTTSTETQAMCDVVLEATRAAIPANLLAQILAGRGRTRSRASSVGRAGALQHSKLRGRPVGVKRGEPRAGVRLSVLETLRAAAPWQRWRRAGRGEAHEGTLARIEIRREDFHVTRLKQRAETTTIFAVDASGSSALHRLAETKGAIELLLADCYVRRDRVALVAFRGSGADLLLPPTRSLVRVKRSLAALPGGGGTPLASGIDAGTTLATAVLSRGGTPTLVLLTDGRANIARDGKPGRPQAEEEALIAARRVRETQFTTLLIDTSPHPHPFAQRLAAEMGARYVALPHADSAALSQAVMMARE